MFFYRFFVYGPIGLYPLVCHHHVCHLDGRVRTSDDFGFIQPFRNYCGSMDQLAYRFVYDTFLCCGNSMLDSYLPIVDQMGNT